MKTSQLKPGVIKVKHPELPEPFLLSIVENTGLIGVKPFHTGEKQPDRGTHLILTSFVRAWIGKLIPMP